MLVITVAVESLLYNTPSHPKGRFLLLMRHELVQKVHAPLCCILLFSSIIITKLLLACQVALTACFRNWKISYTSLGFCHWPFGGWPVTRYCRLKSGHSNEGIYRKPIDWRLKTLFSEGFQPTALYDQKLLSHGSFFRISFAFKHKYKILKKFSSKNKLRQSQKNNTITK